jgi:integrase
MPTITKSFVDSVEPTGKTTFHWDDKLSGFGLCVTATGSKSFVATYRAGRGRNAAVKRVVLGKYGPMTPDQGRTAAKRLLGSVALGADPASERAAQRAAPTVAAVVEEFLSRHVEAKRAAKTAVQYRDLLRRLLVPALGNKRAIDVKRADLARLHLDLAAAPFQANRLIAVAASMFAWAIRHGLLPEEHGNPAQGIERYREDARERFLNIDELARLGDAIRLGETDGFPYEIDETKPGAKHAPKADNRRVRLDPAAAAALRLLLLTGARVSEILTLEWTFLDVERGLLALPRSKTGRKVIVLNAPALAVLASLPKVSRYCFPGVDPDRPRHDLKKPWAAVQAAAGVRCRLHDLRHSHAAVGAGAGLSLPIIGKLLGHSQAATTARYAHLADDPLRRASERIGEHIDPRHGRQDRRQGPGCDNPRKALKARQ